MNNLLLLGIGRFIVKLPELFWTRQVESGARNARVGSAFMTEDHQKIRDFVVTELPKGGGAIPSEIIAERLNIPLKQVEPILDELENRMTFLYRNEQGAVAWAYPVTADPTPHHVTFSTGEQVHAA